MRIETLPLTNAHEIIVFQGRPNTHYSLGSAGVVYDKVCLETNFTNKRISLNGKQMLGCVLTISENKIDRLYSESNINVEKPKKHLFELLKNNGWDVESEVWIICNKFNKKLSGKKIMVEFNFIGLDYKNTVTEELTVFMSPLNSKTKKITFSIEIPKHIYEKCLSDPDPSLRPKFNYIEVTDFSRLHSTLDSLANQAYSLQKRESEASVAKKIICINFNSSDSIQKDSYNFAYVGKRTQISFNYYVCFQTLSGERYTFFRVEEGKVVDNTISGKKSYITSNPSVCVEWTQEREDFLKELENRFIDLSFKLNVFLKDLNQEKLDKLIENKVLLLKQ